jgi:hypothetical protein
LLHQLQHNAIATLSYCLSLSEIVDKERVEGVQLHGHLLICETLKGRNNGFSSIFNPGQAPLHMSLESAKQITIATKL